MRKTWSVLEWSIFPIGEFLKPEVTEFLEKNLVQEANDDLPAILN